MKGYILIIIFINILITISTPPLPPKQVTHSPSLPIKQNRYNKNGQTLNKNINSAPKHHTVKTYNVAGQTFAECNDMMFRDVNAAQIFCHRLNEYEKSKCSRVTGRSCRFLIHRRKEPLGSQNSLFGSKSSLLGSQNSLSGSKSSLLGSQNSLSGSKSSVLGSQNSLSGSRSTLFGSQGTLSGSRDSSFGSKSTLFGSKSTLFGSKNTLLGSRNTLLESQNTLTGSADNLSGRKNSISGSKESLNKKKYDRSHKKDALENSMETITKSHKIWKEVWNDCGSSCLSEDSFETYKHNVLTEINLYRSYHKVKHLTISRQLSDIAQTLADKYSIKHKFDVDSISMYGMTYSSAEITAAPAMVKKWYDTILKYSFLLATPKSKKALYFAQLVWAKTEKIGIGVQRDGNNIYLVCLYHPKGNKKGQYRKNVHKFVEQKRV